MRVLLSTIGSRGSVAAAVRVDGAKRAAERLIART
jgi:hypothetical protein